MWKPERVARLRDELRADEGHRCCQDGAGSTYAHQTAARALPPALSLISATPTRR
jgi:hypothetical protein